MAKQTIKNTKKTVTTTRRTYIGGKNSSKTTTGTRRCPTCGKPL